MAPARLFIYGESCWAYDDRWVVMDMDFQGLAGRLPLAPCRFDMRPSFQRGPNTAKTLRLHSPFTIMLHVDAAR